MDLSGYIIILVKITNEANKNMKIILVIFIYRKILTMREIIPITTAMIAPSTNKSFHL